MRGLGLHVLASPPSLHDLLQVVRPAVMKFVDPPDNPPLASDLTVGRIYEISEQKDLTDPEALAIAHANAAAARADKTGIQIWEGINELYGAWQDTDLCARLQRYELKRCDVLHARGLGAAVLCVNTGWPTERPDHTIDWSGMTTLLTTMTSVDVLEVHEYFRPDGPNGSARLNEAGRFLRCPFPNVRIFTGELGVDFSGGQRDGWRLHGLTPEQYAAQWIEYRDLAASDPRWVGGTPFTYGHFAGGDWESFDWEPFWQKFVLALQPIPDAPRRTIRVRRVALGRTETVELEEYLRGVVPAEVYPSWAFAVLRAQAVAARSYAVACAEARRWAAYDVDDTAEYQVYDPTKVQPRTDQAVGETRGLVLLERDVVKMSEYKARCGRPDCVYCRDKPGLPVHLDQFCQYGGNDMANAGASFREILHHYYTNARLSDEADAPPVIVTPPDEPPVPRPVPPGRSAKLLAYPQPPKATPLGVYWTPTAHNSHVNQLSFAVLCKAMGVRWVTLGDDGDASCCEPNLLQGGVSPLRMLLDQGIMPVVRMMEGAGAIFAPRNEHGLLVICQEFVKASWVDGMYFFWQNECEQKREWDPDPVPKDWLQVVWRNFVNGAYKVRELEARWKAEGIIPATFHVCLGTPALTSWLVHDSAGKWVNPFLDYMTAQERHDLFEVGFCWLNIHNYLKNHPVDYPDDAVTQTGLHLTDEQFQAALDEVQAEYRRTVRPWVWESWETSAAHINLLRDAGRSPGKTVANDDVGFRMYRGANTWLTEADLLDLVPIGSSEGGSVMDNREDGRWPRVTVQEQIRATKLVLAEAMSVPNYFFVNSWLLGVSIMGVWTEDSFEGDAWLTDRHNDVFGLHGRVPLVDALIEIEKAGGFVPGPSPEPIPEPTPEPEPEPGGEPMIVTRTIDPNTTEYRASADGKVRACRVDIVGVEPAAAALGTRAPLKGDGVARVTSLRFLDEDAAGQMTTISVRVRNLAGDPLAGQTVRFAWPRQDMPDWDGTAQGLTEPNKGAEFAMGGANFDPVKDALGPYAVFVPGLPSEVALGFGLPGNRHVSYEVEFTLCLYHVADVVVDEPEPEPEPEPDWTEPPMAQMRLLMRESGWNALGINYNPGSAFYKHAAANGLYGPLSNEYDPTDQLPEAKRPPRGLYVAQDWRGQFGDVTLWAVVGHYDQIWSVPLVA